MPATNVPYVKEYKEVTKNGKTFTVLANPITKKNPYINKGENRFMRKPDHGRVIHNGNRDSIVVHKMLIPDENGENEMVLGKTQ